MFKGQGAVEYLLVLGAVIVIAVVLMLMISGINQTGQCQGTSNIDNFRDLTIQLSNASGYLGEVTEYCNALTTDRCNDFQFKSGSVVSRENTPWRQFKTSFTLPLQNDACFTGLDQIWVRFGMRNRAVDQNVFIDKVCLTEYGEDCGTLNLIVNGSFDDPILNVNNEWKGGRGSTCTLGAPDIYDPAILNIETGTGNCKDGARCVRMAPPTDPSVCQYWFQQPIYFIHTNATPTGPNIPSGSVNEDFLKTYGGKKMEFSYWYRSVITN